MKQIKSDCHCSACGKEIKWCAIVDKRYGDILSFQTPHDHISLEPTWDRDKIIFLRFRCPHCDKINELTHSYD